MKKINIYSIVLSLLVFTGCELDVDPHTFVSDQNYYKTEAQIITAVNGVYSGLQRIYSGTDTQGAIYMLTELRSDNSDYHYYNLDRGIQQREDISDFLMHSASVYNQYVWTELYNTIQQANKVIGSVGTAEFQDEKLRTRSEGEARFIRAFLYFHLVRLYGEVPLRLEATTGPGDAFTPVKATVDEIYAQIKEDVKFAIENLEVSYTGTNVGRATKGAALTLEGEVYLTLKDYQQAITSFEAVSKLGYELMDSYEDIFSPNHKNNIESIFEIQYSASVEGEHSNYIFAWGPRYSRLELTGFTGDLAGTNTPTVDLYKAYEEGDIRRDATIAFFVDPRNRAFQESLGAGLSVIGDSLMFVNKFYHKGSYTVNGRANENWPVYRYAYLKLMLADALNEAGKSSEALIHVNDIRKRAGLDAVSTTSQGELREIIFKETRLEVAMENHRWYQLLRTGRAKQVMTDYGKFEKARLKVAADILGEVCHLIDASFDIQDYKLLYPLPERECRLNGFKNNPGW